MKLKNTCALATLVALAVASLASHAQTQTLKALKTHKQGLMQQLFPSPEAVEA